MAREFSKMSGEIMSTQKFEIWSEGYIASGTEGRKTDPVYHGTCRGNSFEDACRNLLEGNKYFDSEELTHWGCKLYPSRFEAFGMAPEDKDSFQ